VRGSPYADLDLADGNIELDGKNVLNDTGCEPLYKALNTHKGSSFELVLEKKAEKNVLTWFLNGSKSMPAFIATMRTDHFCKIVNAQGLARMLCLDTDDMTIFSTDPCLQQYNTVQSTQIMVIPRTHTADIVDYVGNTASRLRTILQKCLAIAYRLSPQGSWLIYTNYGMVFQSVPHLHIHIRVTHKDKPLNKPLIKIVPQKAWRGEEFDLDEYLAAARQT
jgi:diadenosine tetraphosphate (Ap4A) HIT family hydrolase